MRNHAALDRLISYTLAASILPISIMALSGRWNWSFFFAQFRIGFIFAVCVAGPLEIAFRQVAPRVHHRGPAVAWPVYGGVIAVMAIVGTLAGAIVICTVGLVPWSGFGPLFWSAVKVSLLLATLFGGSGLAIETARHRLDEANLALRRKEEDEQRARALATEARLQSLESRVHPHFLFNAINSILSLMREDPRRAEDLLERMAALLRYSLDQSQGKLVPLATELQIARDYLAIEQARFGDRLRYEVAEPDAALGAVPVPPLSVQTLVENSVKYAVSPRREGARIVVTARAAERGGGVAVEVVDDGPGFTEAEAGKGHGLDLLRQRVGSVGGSLEFQRPAEGGMAVRIVMA